MALRKCSGVVRSTKVLWADVLRLALRNYSVLLENKIFLGEEKGTCFQLKIGLSTETASFFLLGVFLPRRMLQTIC